MTDIRTAADQQARAALRAAADYYQTHGHRSGILDSRYEAAERVVDAIDAFDVADALAADAVDEWQTAVLTYSVESGESHDPLPDIALAITLDPGDITVFPMGVGR